MNKTTQNGFSLLEILVAFSILSLSLGILYQSFALGLRNVKVAEDYTVATLLAESQLALIGYDIPLEEGENTGEFEQHPRFHWQLNVKPYPIESGDWISKVRHELFAVTMQVSWGTDDKQRKLVLETLRLAEKQ